MENWKLNSNTYFPLKLKRCSFLISVKWMLLEVLLHMTKYRVTFVSKKNSYCKVSVDQLYLTVFISKSHFSRSCRLIHHTGLNLNRWFLE